MENEEIDAEEDDVDNEKIEQSSSTSENEELYH